MPADSDVQNEAAAFRQLSINRIELTGLWTASYLSTILDALDQLAFVSANELTVQAERMIDLDSVGAWVLQKFLSRAKESRGGVNVIGLKPRFERLLSEVATNLSAPCAEPSKPRHTFARALQHLNQLGVLTYRMVLHARDFLAFIGEAAASLGRWAVNPTTIRWQPILFNIRSAGFDALPIVALLSILLGIVVGYQGADQLKRYGASIFIADLVGLSMLREFAPLMTAIIIAGRSGSAYAAQIGTMAVTEEIDAMKTLGIEPMEVLVLPKLMGLLIALPLLTVFADFLGVLGGMLMAQQKLGISFPEFLDRFGKAVSVTAFMIGIGKAPVFAGVIALVGCYQGFRTKGGADSVGRQTTRSVVQAVFLVIVADALFSIAFSALDL
jgi:phospholipid/cholesterol/gamma-HCH transport system permease protein